MLLLLSGPARTSSSICRRVIQFHPAQCAVFTLVVLTGSTSLPCAAPYVFGRGAATSIESVDGSRAVATPQASVSTGPPVEIAPTPVRRESVPLPLTALSAAKTYSPAAVVAGGTPASGPKADAGALSSQPKFTRNGAESRERIPTPYEPAIATLIPTMQESGDIGRPMAPPKRGHISSHPKSGSNLITRADGLFVTRFAKQGRAE